jgi:hypothetical protein
VEKNSLKEDSMHIQIQGSKNARSVVFYTEGIPVSSQLQTIPDEVEQSIQIIESYCLTQQTPEQVLVNSTQEKIDNIINAFDVWTPNGVEYTAGNVVSYDGILYKVVQGHNSQADWAPKNSVSLFTDITTRKIGDETGTPGEWVQPIGAQDSYILGDKVSHNSKIWESTANDNVWEPGVYGWNEIV